MFLSCELGEEEDDDEDDDEKEEIFPLTLLTML